ncbi:ureidoglycolate lyase [Oculatella sp. LEGE 06141]|uniref:ureidoglycolate lyase n=1 Tax=Oculatella sp. LEGE 06141 TaxID=1828648 RepID=UPI00187E1B80|nr:ureidoglycolate lyase [Oculatella sp. LEGE 06141]MBE9181015.1 ureidoglycolate lyase [Oculatella sp. LEGE 06141]
MTQSTSTLALPIQRLSAAAFQPYGQVIFASSDGKPYDADDAQLTLDRGIPRFYIMRLHRRGRTFSHITRHVHCTQCLGSLEGKPWLMAVAPPSNTSKPDLKAIAAFQIPGNCFIKLHLGTWHAGPYFEQDVIDFYNLELSDTNVTDHFTHNLLESDGIEFEMVWEKNRSGE